MCKSSAPDTSGMNQAAVDTAQLGQQSLQWFENYVAQTQPQRDATSALDNQVAQAQLSGMQQAQQQAADLANRNKTVFQPLEDQLVSQAQAYDTPERRQAAADAARADVAQEAAAQTAAQNRALGRAGIAPGSSKAMAMGNDMAIMTSLGEQSAAARARQQVEATGHAMEMDAAGLGKGILGSQATMLQTAQSGGQATTGASGAGLAAATSAAPLMQTGFGQGMQGSQIAGNLYGQAGQLSAMENNNLFGGIGGLASMAGMFMQTSSRAAKTDIRDVSDEKALEAVNDLPVKAWKYRPGVEDGGDHVGPIAEDVQRVMGDQVAPGGKMVDLGLMQQMNRKAIQRLTTQLAEVNGKIKQLEGVA